METTIEVNEVQLDEVQLDEVDASDVYPCCSVACLLGSGLVILMSGLLFMAFISL